MTYATNGMAQDSSAFVGDTYANMSLEELRKQLMVDPLISQAKKKKSSLSPGSSLGAPSGYGASQNNAFVGLSYIGSGDNNAKADGSGSFGMGFGDPVKSAGFEVSVAIVSLKESFAEDGSVGVKLHKIFPDLGNIGVGLGWSNAINWGQTKTAEDTYYLALSGSKNIVKAVSYSVGLGTGSHRKESDIVAQKQGVGIFGSLGVRVHNNVSLIATWGGSQLNLGTSFVIPDVPFVFNLGFMDVSDERGSGTRVQLSAGYSFDTRDINLCASCK